MSDTPETNLFYSSFADGLGIPNQDEWLALCQRLQSERDEARREAERFRAMHFGPPPYSKVSKLPWEQSPKSGHVSFQLGFNIVRDAKSHCR